MNERTILERVRAVAARIRRAAARDRPVDEEPPLRSELYSADQMERHGRSLAATHRLAPGRARNRLLARLAANERILADVCEQQTAAVAANSRITPAAEWLLDNFYLIEEQIRTARRHLPRAYNRELLLNTEFAAVSAGTELIAPGTVEEKIWDLQQRKAQTIVDVLGEEGFARSLTKTDLEYLFSED